MPTKIGTVNQIDNMRTVNTKFGQKTVFDIYLTDGMKLSSWKKPAITVGQTYEFDYTSNSYGNDFKGATPTTGAPPSSASVALPAPASSPVSTFGSPALLPTVGGPRDPFGFENGTRPFPLPLKHGDRSFVRKDALTQAVNSVHIFFDTNNGSVSPEAVIELARKFEDYLSGDRDVELANAILNEDDPAARLAQLSAKKSA